MLPEFCSSEALQGLAGSSPLMTSLRHTAETVARFPSTVLVQGESGTGKELLARGIHESSQRKLRPFVTVDCTVLTDSLFESLMFGHEKGSFTGATHSTQGLVRAADGGTLFLDEVGELSAAGQAKLLRLLQEHTVTPVGATKPIKVDLRIIAATHRDLLTMATQGRFRFDLYYRLNVIAMKIPALRERREDIPGICERILGKLEAFLGIRAMINPEAMQAIMMHTWPGNVRELAACLERACVVARDGVIIAEDLGLPVIDARSQSSDSPLNLETGERAALLEALRVCDGNKSRAAAMLGVDRRTVYRMIDRLERDRAAIA